MAVLRLVLGGGERRTSKKKKDYWCVNSKARADVAESEGGTPGGMGGRGCALEVGGWRRTVLAPYRQRNQDNTEQNLEVT